MQSVWAKCGALWNPWIPSKGDLVHVRWGLVWLLWATLCELWFIEKEAECRWANAPNGCCVPCLSSRKKLHTGCAVGSYLEVSEFCGGMALGVAGIWRPVFSGWSSSQVANVYRRVVNEATYWSWVWWGSAHLQKWHEVSLITWSWCVACVCCAKSLEGVFQSREKLYFQLNEWNI